MPDRSFDDLPSIELLQWFARGSLRQNLPRAIRLWVWLRFLYGSDAKILPDGFTFAEWRSTFFTASHPTGEALPQAHDSQCRCDRTVAEWLFSAETGLTESWWRQSLQQHDAMPNNLSEILATPLFRVTRRTLYEDLQILNKLGWVKRRGQTYSRVENFPTRPTIDRPSQSAIMAPDLAAIADSLTQQINGQSRFFLHTEYIVPAAAIDRVDDWQAVLRQVWEQIPVSPVELIYNSAKFNQQMQSIVYPVCIYYVQRAPYLCGWGEIPNRAEQIDWRNYRLDRILAITPLTWEEPRIPLVLQQAFQTQTLPTPDFIQEQMEAAWGFDFYQPERVLLLRFDRWFHEGYIKGTVRHATFEQVSYAEAGQLIHEQTPDRSQRQALLQVWRSRSRTDGYYQAIYRDGDLNLMLRLRAWRPHMEILLPWDLRQQMKLEAKRETEFYQD